MTMTADGYRDAVMTRIRRFIRLHYGNGWTPNQIRDWLDTQGLTETEMSVCELILKHQSRDVPVVSRYRESFYRIHGG